jgi:hypothetical protein
MVADVEGSLPFLNFQMVNRQGGFSYRMLFITSGIIFCGGSFIKPMRDTVDCV